MVAISRSDPSRTARRSKRWTRFEASRLARLAAGFALSAAAAWPLASPARADMIPLDSMLRGITMTPAQCASLPLTIWVTAPRGGYCIRYYLSTAGGEGRWATVFLQGDQFGKANLRAGTFDAVPPGTKDTDTANLQRMADMFSKRARGPAIYLARIGVDGSSGYHIVRHSVLELQVVNAAITGIKQRHGYDGFHLAGQSGGGTLVGGLLSLRQDIGCAVPGSGRLASLDGGRRQSFGDPGRTWFDPTEAVAQIARNRARILVVTDPEDKRVPLRNQTTFVERLRQAGGQAEQYFVQAIDENRHGTVAYSSTAVSACIRGESQQAIAQTLAELVKVRVANAQKIRAENQRTGATPTPPTRTARMDPPRPAPAPMPPAPGPAMRPAPVAPAPAMPAPQTLYPQQRQAPLAPAYQPPTYQPPTYQPPVVGQQAMAPARPMPQLPPRPAAMPALQPPIVMAPPAARIAPPAPPVTAVAAPEITAPEITAPETAGRPIMYRRTAKPAGAPAAVPPAPQVEPTLAPPGPELPSEERGPA